MNNTNGKMADEDAPRRRKSKSAGEDDTPKKRKSKTPSSSSSAVTAPPQPVDQGPLVIPPLIQQMVKVYSVEEVPNFLFNEKMMKITVHMDICSARPRSSPPTVDPTRRMSAKVTDSGDDQINPPYITGTNGTTKNAHITQHQLIFPGVTGPVKITCIGCKRWSVRGDVSIAVDFGVDGPKTVRMNSSEHLFTLAANHSSYGPECLFALKPDSPLQTLFPKLTEKDVDKGCFPTFGPLPMVAAPVDLNPDTGMPVCPVGYVMREIFEAGHQPYKLLPMGNNMSYIEVTRDYFNAQAESLKDQVRDGRINFNPAEHRVIFTPSNLNDYYASITFDIYYCKC